MDDTSGIVVTGGAGFIGSALVRALVADGGRITTVDKLGYAGSLANLAAVEGRPNHRFIKANIADAATMTRVFAEARPRTVFHLAAESHVDRTIDGPMDAVTSNVTGTAVLLEAALAHWRSLDASGRSAFRFVHVSTDEVFGSLGTEGRFDESSPHRPNSPYAATKAASEHLAHAWHATYGLPVMTVNATNTYGPYQHPEKLIPHMVLCALAGDALPVYGDGSQVRDWLHVDDHVAALRTVAARGRAGARYALGGRNERRNIDIVRAICATLDEMLPAGKPHAHLIAFVADRPGHDARYALDPARTEAELGWRARTAFDDGLAKTVRWYAARPGAWPEYHRARLGLGRMAGAGTP